MERGDGVGVGGEEGEDDTAAGGQIAVGGVAAEDLVEEGRGVGDGLGPGFDDVQDEVAGVGVVDEESAFFDVFVEGGDADAEAFGFGAADAVVVQGGECGQAVEGGKDRGPGLRRSETRRSWRTATRAEGSPKFEVRSPKVGGVRARFTRR